MFNSDPSGRVRKVFSPSFVWTLAVILGLALVLVCGTVAAESARAADPAFGPRLDIGSDSFELGANVAMDAEGISLGKKKLKPGRYRMTVIAIDQEGAKFNTVRTTFRVSGREGR